MMVWALVGAFATLTTLVGASSAPSALQMAYARTAVAMRTCEATALKELKSNPSIGHTSLVWPNGSPDGGNLLHSAGKYGCYDIMQELIVDFDLDPAEEAQPGAGLTGKTPYDLCVSARERSQADGQPDACDPDKWVELVEEAVEFKAQGGKHAAELIKKRGPQPQAPKRKRSAIPGGDGTDPSKIGQPGYDKDGKKGKSVLSPAERRRQMEERIAEKKRLKAEQTKSEL